MSDDEDGIDLTPPYDLTDPELMLLTSTMLPSGWTEWYRYKSGRYREIVVERRRNPFALFGPLGVVHLVAYLFARWLPWTSIAGPFDVFRAGLSPETAYGAIPIVGAALIGGWIVAGVVVRLRTRETEQFDRDRMYPPAEYWEDEDVGCDNG